MMYVRLSAGRKQILIAIAILSMLLFIYSPISETFAATCLPASHCYVLEHEDGLTNYGNKFTTIISDLTLSNYTTNFITVEQWVAFPNGDYVEGGTMTGRNPVTHTTYTDERAFYATTLTGSAYNEVTSSTVAVGSTQTYEISDSNHDKTYLFKRGGSQYGSATVVNTNAVEMEVGAETTVDSGLPKTHIYNITWLKNDGTWNLWASADSIIESPSTSPLWILNCTPNYQHIHVGSGATGNCT